MPVKFTADEIFEMADKMEDDGAEFYRQASESAPTEEARRLLIELAEWEKDHKQTFSELRDKFAGEGGIGFDYDPDGQAAQYLRTFVEGRVFSPESRGGAKLQGSESMSEILEIALQLEKDSVLFYLGIKDVVDKDQDKARIDKIITQERQHMVTLTRMMEASEK